MTASSPSDSGTGHGTRSGPSAIPARKTAAGGITASSPHRARNPMLSDVTVPASTMTSAGTSSAWYEPTGRVMVSSCFQPSASAASSCTMPSGLGSTPAYAADGTASGTPAATRTAKETSTTTNDGQRQIAPAIA